MRLCFIPVGMVIFFLAFIVTKFVPFYNFTGTVFPDWLLIPLSDTVLVSCASDIVS